MSLKYEAAYALDVIEHIEDEWNFISNIAKSLLPDGICIVGTPNVTASEYASEYSREAHINLQSHKSLNDLMRSYFVNVFAFSMNDEVVHTGFYDMAHYLIFMGVGVK